MVLLSINWHLFKPRSGLDKLKEMIYKCTCSFSPSVVAIECEMPAVDGLGHARKGMLHLPNRTKSHISPHEGNRSISIRYYNGATVWSKFLFIVLLGFLFGCQYFEQYALKRLSWCVTHCAQFVFHASISARYRHIGLIVAKSWSEYHVCLFTLEGTLSERPSGAYIVIILFLLIFAH